MWGHSKKAAICWPERRPSPRTQSCRCPDFGLPASRTVRSKCLSFKPPIYGIFVIAVQIDEGKSLVLVLGYEKERPPGCVNNHNHTPKKCPLAQGPFLPSPGKMNYSEPNTQKAISRPSWWGPKACRWRFTPLVLSGVWTSSFLCERDYCLYKKRLSSEGLRLITREYTVLEIGMDEVITMNKSFAWKFCRGKTTPAFFSPNWDQICKHNKYMLNSEILLHGQILYRISEGIL